MEAIDRALSDALVAAACTHDDEIGQHYATHAAEWRERFVAQHERGAALGFDHEFRRMWEFYLAYCEAGFATGAMGDVQMLLSRPVRLGAAAACG